MSMNGASWKLLVVIGPQATAVFGLVLERVLLGSREVVLRCIRKLGGKISHFLRCSANEVPLSYLRDGLSSGHKNLILKFDFINKISFSIILSVLYLF